MRNRSSLTAARTNKTVGSREHNLHASFGFLTMHIICIFRAQELVGFTLWWENESRNLTEGTSHLPRHKNVPS